MVDSNYPTNHPTDEPPASQMKFHRATHISLILTCLLPALLFTGFLLLAVDAADALDVFVSFVFFGLLLSPVAIALAIYGNHQAKKFPDRYRDAIGFMVLVLIVQVIPLVGLLMSLWALMFESYDL